MIKLCKCVDKLLFYVIILTKAERFGDQMKKSVYSIVLMDDVVTAIDEMAYQYKASRSNLINQILADHVSLATPEKRMREVFVSLKDLMSDTFQFQFQPSDSILTLHSPLQYKYRPTIRYSVELGRSSEAVLGKLKIVFRTQSPKLISYLAEFYRILILLEKQYLEGAHKADIGYLLEDGRFTRDLMLPTDKESLSDQELGSALAAYIQLMDAMIKVYFATLESPDVAKLESLYKHYVKKNSILI